MDSKNTATSGKKKAGGAIAALIIALAAFGLGWYFGSGEQAKVAEHADHGTTATRTEMQSDKDQAHEMHAKADIWTCSMHPQIRKPGPGKCPICGMDLVSVASLERDSAGKNTRLVMSEEAKRLARVRTAPVKRQRGYVKLRLVGMVFEDETRMAALTSRVHGRLDAVHVDFNGVTVKKGDPMVTIWSPDLIKAQVELFETIRSPAFGEAEIKGGEERLIEMGLTPEQMKEIRKRKKPVQNITLRAPISGVVMKKNALLGQFVKEGDVMYDITDLSKVWIKLDAYESDLPWIRYGQKVTFTTPAIPGKTFTGTVLFIDPVLQMNTRSVKVRVEADNPDLALKPHMFVSAELDAEVDANGDVVNTEWAGKYICPFHPDAVYDTPQKCPKSGALARPASSYGYAEGPNPMLPLIVPHGAVLYTGKRSVVYVEVPGSDRPTYEMREVVLGPAASDGYVIYGGLNVGENVVVKGNFKIDSAAQIAAKDSMMTPREGPMSRDLARDIEKAHSGKTRMKAPHSLKMAFEKIFPAYWQLKSAFVLESSDEITRRTKTLWSLLKNLDTADYSLDIHTFLHRYAHQAVENLTKLIGRNDIASRREQFAEVSQSLAILLIGFKDLVTNPVYLYAHPTEFSKTGAYWIEETRDPKNPYSGKKKISSGDLIAVFPLKMKHDSSMPEAEHGGSGAKGKTENEGSASKVKINHNGSASKPVMEHGTSPATGDPSAMEGSGLKNADHQQHDNKPPPNNEGSHGKHE